MVKHYKYIIVGTGLTGSSAADAIRSIDKSGSILLIGNERHRPYHRPPLTKQLWSGKKTVDKIFAHTPDYYTQNNVEVLFDTNVTQINNASRQITCQDLLQYTYDKLLLATGGIPRRLTIPGGTMEGLIYFRYLDDYLTLRPMVSEGIRVLLIGGGFIGSELSAALNMNKADVTVVHPDNFLLERIFPESLARTIQQDYIKRGVHIFSKDTAVSIKHDTTYTTHTSEGKVITSDIVVVAVGIEPETELGRQVGLQIERGFIVDEYCRTSSPDIFAAGDNSQFPYGALGQRMRVEHWDHAINHGTCAGRNMAGAHEPYTYMPYFFSDLFEFGFEAVGEVHSKLDTFVDWKDENKTGIIYYLRENIVRGVMLCNVWEKVNAARELIRGQKTISPSQLKGAIPF